MCSIKPVLAYITGRRKSMGMKENIRVLGT